MRPTNRGYSLITELDKTCDTAVGYIASGKHCFNAVNQFVSRAQKSTHPNNSMLGNRSRALDAAYGTIADIPEMSQKQVFLCVKSPVSSRKSNVISFCFASPIVARLDSNF